MDDLTALDKAALVDKAKKLGIDAKSSWNKGKLIAEIEAKTPAAPPAPEPAAEPPAPPDPPVASGTPPPAAPPAPEPAAEPKPEAAGKLHAAEYDPDATYVVTAPFKASVHSKSLRSFQAGQTLAPSIARQLVAGGVRDIAATYPDRDPDES